ncbi:MAG TPA: hypothetical protein VNN12_02620 [Dehalococcoidia bacterium]|nr:hypothetical protein [Dehalococcoidia bacterium]
MRTRRIFGFLALVAVLAGVGFGAGRLLFDRLQTEAQAPETSGFTPELQRLLEEEKQKPRFTGELLGIYIAPTEDQWPEEVRERRREIVAGGCANAPLEQARELDFPRPLVLPEGYALAPGYPEAIACGGRVTGINREYTFQASNGLAANVLIARSVSREATIDAAADRVIVTTIAGRDAILVRPVTPDSVMQTSRVIFPEPFGTTQILAAYLPESDLLEVAEAVAVATKE